MKKLVINVTEDSMEVAEIISYYKFMKIPKVVDFTPIFEDEKNLYDFRDNIIAMKALLQKNNISAKNVDVVLSIDGVITRLIEVPHMTEKDLKSFIKNNIDQYFTVSMESYIFDYQVLEVIKKDKLFFNILLVAVPKDKFEDIKRFLKNCGLNLSSVNIYPQCVSKVFEEVKDKSIAVLDAGSKRSSITILDQGKIFVYSLVYVDLNDENNYEELLDNLSYFLNFYASRHFGKKLNKVVVTGEYSQMDSFILYLASNIEGQVDNDLEELDIKVRLGNDVVMENYIEILGNSLNRRYIYNKKIDFIQEISPKKGRDINIRYQFIMAAVLIFLVTVFWYSYKFYSLSLQLKKYSIPVVNTNTAVYDKQLQDIAKEEEKYKLKAGYINDIKNDEFNYTSILEAFKTSLPKDVTVKSIKLDKQKVTLVLNTNNSTLNVARAISAVNNMKMFETYDISQVKLDDSVNEVTMDLKIKNPN